MTKISKSRKFANLEFRFGRKAEKLLENSNFLNYQN